MAGFRIVYSQIIHEKQSLAFYVHCAAHNLNLVVNDAVSGVCEVQDCFSTVQELCAFFGHSIRRWDLMASITDESAVTLCNERTGSHCFGEQEVLSVVMH